MFLFRLVINIDVGGSNCIVATHYNYEISIPGQENPIRQPLQASHQMLMVTASQRGSLDMPEFTPRYTNMGIV